MQFLLSDEQLRGQLSVPDFQIKTQQQIAKDFALSGFDFDEQFLNNELNYEEIIDSVAIKLEEVFIAGEQTLLQLLYQIDVPQNTFLNLVGNDSMVIELSEIILRREAYKVYLRSKF